MKSKSLLWLEPYNNLMSTIKKYYKRKNLDVFLKILLSHSLFVKVQGNEVLLTWLVVTLNKILLKYNFKNFLNYDNFLKLFVFIIIDFISNLNKEKCYKFIIYK